MTNVNSIELIVNRNRMCRREEKRSLIYSEALMKILERSKLLLKGEGVEDIFAGAS